MTWRSKLQVSARLDPKAEQMTGDYLVVCIAWRTFLIRKTLRLDAALLVEVQAIQFLEARLTAMHTTLAYHMTRTISKPDGRLL
jgi:hypothetical protein